MHKIRQRFASKFLSHRIASLYQYDCYRTKIFSLSVSRRFSTVAKAMITRICHSLFLSTFIHSSVPYDQIQSPYPTGRWIDLRGIFILVFFSPSKVSGTFSSPAFPLIIFLLGNRHVRDSAEKYVLLKYNSQNVYANLRVISLATPGTLFVLFSASFSA